MSSKSDPKPWNSETMSWDRMPGSLNNNYRRHNYLKGGRKELTPKQKRRMMKHTLRSVHNYVMSCGHRMKKCECPF